MLSTFFILFIVVIVAFLINTQILLSLLHCFLVKRSKVIIGILYNYLICQASISNDYYARLFPFYSSQSICTFDFRQIFKTLVCKIRALHVVKIISKEKKKTNPCRFSSFFLKFLVCFICQSKQTTILFYIIVTFFLRHHTLFIL